MLNSLTCSVLQRFMSRCDATVFNLSMLTSDAWGAFWAVILFHQRLNPIYFVALAIEVVGVVIYNSGRARISFHDTAINLYFSLLHPTKRARKGMAQPQAWNAGDASALPAQGEACELA